MTGKPSIEDVRALEQFIAGAGATKHLLTFQGILRRHEEMRAALSTPPADDDLTDDEYDAKYGLPGPLDDRYPGRPNPSADDVREALALIVEDNFEAEDEPHRTADAILAAFEVRPHGTVTDAERSAINGALAEGLPIWTSEVEAAYARKPLLDRIVRALEAAREVHP